MYKLGLALLIVGCLGDVTFYSYNQCSCSQLQTQTDCSLKSYCKWDGSSCSTQSCGDITAQASCAANSNCMWKGTSCVDFTFCSQLSGVTQNACLALSVNCPYTDGSICGGQNQLKKCSYFTASQYCEGYISNDGVCFWNNGSCQAAQDCTKLNSQECTTANLGNACIYTNNTCSQALCSSYTTQSACTYVRQSMYSRAFQLCSWNSQNSTCVGATDYGGLGAGNCYTGTRGTARWTTSGSGQCQSCYGWLLQFVMVIIMIII